MNGVRFYLEHTSSYQKRKGNHMGNVIAVFPENRTVTYMSDGGVSYEAVAAVYDSPNSPVATTGVSPKYLRLACKRISETKAREIHPELFKILDRE